MVHRGVRPRGRAMLASECVGMDAPQYHGLVSNYKGPATVTLTDGTRYRRGTFVPDDGSPVNTGNATIEVSGRSAAALIQDWRFDGQQGTAVLLGQNEPPF